MNNHLPEKPLVEVKNLCKYFKISKKEILKAVDDITLTINRGQTVGLVGESGCGKSTLGRCLVKLYNPTSGNIYFEGKDIFQASRIEKKEFSQKVQMIFQNPYASLNPRMTVKDIIGEGLKLYSNSREEIENQVLALLETVGLNKDHISRFPHEFSGGQRQRIGIARALATNPEFIVCDEPISALDVSVQAQVINMLKQLQAQLKLTFLFIAHDLSVVKYLSDQVVVMYLGMIMESAGAEELFENPSHPYTQVLLSAIPKADPHKAKSEHRIQITGEVPSPINPKPCCRFAQRCPNAKDICYSKMPEAKDIGSGHMVACHLV